MPTRKMQSQVRLLRRRRLPRLPHSSSPLLTAAIAGSADDAMDLGRSEDLDEFWSNLMSDLQSRHLPSYSLISQFGFPLSVRQDGVGDRRVLKENFQKMIERQQGRADQNLGQNRLRSRALHKS